MRIINETQFTLKDITEAARFSGVNLKSGGLLIVSYLGKSEDLDSDGVCLNAVTQVIHHVKVRQGKSLAVLVHEMRHVGQAQQLGGDVFNILYKVELEAEGYNGSILEADARACQRAWERMNKEAV